MHVPHVLRSGSRATRRAVGMTAVEVLSNALDETDRFLTASQGLDCYSQVLEQQCAAILRQCQNLPRVTSEEACMLIQQVKLKLQGKAMDISPMVLAITGKIGSDKTGSPSRQKQTLTNWAGYLTQKDLTMLRSQNASNYSKLDHIAVRMVRLGLDVPTEPTAGHVLKLLGHKATFTMHVYLLTIAWT